MRIFIDGVQAGEATVTVPYAPPARSALCVGGCGGGNPTINGTIDEFFITNRPLTGAEVTEVMTGVTGFGTETLTRFRIEQPNTESVRLYNDTQRPLNLKLEVMR
jgi:hypothetical protein